MEDVSKYIEYIKSINKDNRDKETKSVTKKKEEKFNEEEIDKPADNYSKEESKETYNVSASSRNLILSESIPYKYDLPKSSKIIRAMVVIARFNVIVPIQSITRIDYPVLEVKQVEKEIFIKGCSIFFEKDNGILFIDSIIRKHIEYYSCDENINILRNAVVNMPFKFQTKVHFNIMPKIEKDKECREIEILAQNMMGQDSKEKNFNAGKSFNEQIICKMLKFEFMETNIIEGNNSLEEKSVLSIELELLQKQDIVIN